MTEMASMHQYARGLRRRSLYPVFRGVLRFMVVLGHIAAIAIAIFGVLSFYQAEPMPFWLCIGAAVLVSVLSQLLYEISLMVADMADAIIDMAAPSVPNEPRPNLDWKP